MTDLPIQPPLCIVGMHRSGTSMVARLVRDAGLDLGPEEDLSPAKPENPDGFWENMRFVEINEHILAAGGGAWDMPVEIRAASAYPAARTKAEFAALRFRHGRPWGWKDPRNSVTLPFWRTIFPEMKILVCVRNPLEVALSLGKRNQISPEASLKLWLTYNERILANSSSEERLVIHYDAFFAEPDEQVRRIAEFSGIGGEPAPAALAVAINPSLRHNRLTLENLISAEVRADVLEIYLNLCSEAHWIDRLGTAEKLSVSDHIHSATELIRKNRFSDGAILNRAAFERDLFRDESLRQKEEIEHLRAQRDWHSHDRDKLASLLEQHQADAELQQGTIQELQATIEGLRSQLRALQGEDRRSGTRGSSR